MNPSGTPRVGILGGGQLARMLALAGMPLGAQFLVVDPATDACAGQLAPLLVADWNDTEVLSDFAERVDAVTFDFENVPAATLDWLGEHTQVRPAPHALAVAQDRMAEKRLFGEIGLPTAQHAAVDTRQDLEHAVQAIGVPAILKTRRMGYDGKGQFRLSADTDVDAAWTALGAQASRHGLVLEAFVPFQRELSVIAVRSADGEFRAWPLVQNWHVKGILSMSMAPAVVSEEIAAQALQHARRLAEKLDYVGVFALELFVDDDRLLGNEMAPRVHNSGHWSIEGAVTSQFENHLRAVLGMPLGATDARGVSLMFNWIGALPERDVLLRHPHAHWHDYGKQARPGRKLGHATVCADDHAALMRHASALAGDLGCDDKLAPVLAWMCGAAAQ